MTTKEISHTYRINASPASIIAALSEIDRIACWWTNEVREEDGLLVVGWSSHGWEVVLEPRADEAGNRVVWRCLRSNMQDTDAWEGTEIVFELRTNGDGGGTQLDFVQTGYRDSSCYEACVQGWNFFVGTSLRQYVETGRGRPYPEVTDTSRDG